MVLIFFFYLYYVSYYFFFFFFSSRRRHTRCSRDWSSDVCSSDLTLLDEHRPPAQRAPYAAPEQSGRLSRDVDERADLYALGVMLYELATGEPPFGAARSAELIRAQLSGAPTPAATVPPGIS